MSNLIELSTPCKQIRNQHLESWLVNGSIKLMSGTRRATPETALSSQHIIVTFALSASPGTSTNGVFVGTLPEPAMVIESDIPTWAIVSDESGAVVFDCDVGATGSGNVIELMNVNLVSGALVSLTQFQLSEG